MDELWNELPLELVQRIACLLAPPTHLSCTGRDRSAQLQHAQSIRQALLHLALTNKHVRQALRPLLRMARWSVELALLGTRGQPLPDADVLLSDPASATPGDAGDCSLWIKPADEFGLQRLDALLQGAMQFAVDGAEPDEQRGQLADTLLTRLFDAWCARLNQDVQAASSLDHLPLQALPLRLFHTIAAESSYALDPVFMLRTLDYIPGLLHTPSSVPVRLLLQHTERLEEALKLFVCLHIELLLDPGGETPEKGLHGALRQYGLENDPVVETVRRWRKGFLDVFTDQVDLPLAQEVLTALRTMPLLGAPVPLLLLARLCTPALGHLASESERIGLLGRAMAEMTDMVDGVTEIRFEYLFAVIPDELGLPAFNALSMEQRLRVIERGRHAGADLMPYVQALVEASDVPHDRSAPVLDLLLECGSMQEQFRKLSGLRASLSPAPAPALQDALSDMPD